jgi:hypothetical protein
MPKFIERYKETFRNDQEKSPEERERGHNTHVDFTFTRHGTPGKTPEGMSADFILPEGLEQVREVGKKEKAEYVLVTGSSNVKRARETGKSYMEGVNESGLTEIINKKGSEKTAEFGVYAIADLNAIKDVSKVYKPLLDEGKKLIAEGKLQKEELEGYASGKYLQVPEEKFKEQGVATLKETAMEMAHHLSSGIKMSGRLFEGIEVKVNNFTHGPRTECLLKFVLKQKDKTGFDDVKEIGGPVKPGESIDFFIERDEKGELKPIKIKFRGEEYDFDMDKFNQLVEEYQEKKAKK